VQKGETQRQQFALIRIPAAKIFSVAAAAATMQHAKQPKALNPHHSSIFRVWAVEEVFLSQTFKLMQQQIFLVHFRVSFSAAFPFYFP
jgi:hypothetical protein